MNLSESLEHMAELLAQRAEEIKEWIPQSLTARDSLVKFRDEAEKTIPRLKRLASHLRDAEKHYRVRFEIERNMRQQVEAIKAEALLSGLLGRTWEDPANKALMP